MEVDVKVERQEEQKVEPSQPASGLEALARAESQAPRMAVHRYRSVGFATIPPMTEQERDEILDRVRQRGPTCWEEEMVWNANETTTVISNDRLWDVSLPASMNSELCRDPHPAVVGRGGYEREWIRIRESMTTHQLVRVCLTWISVLLAIVPLAKFRAFMRKTFEDNNRVSRRIALLNANRHIQDLVRNNTPEEVRALRVIAGKALVAMTAALFAVEARAQEVLNESWFETPKERFQRVQLNHELFVFAVLVVLIALLVWLVFTMLRWLCRTPTQTIIPTEWRANEITIRDLSTAELIGLYEKYTINGPRGVEQIYVRVSNQNLSFKQPGLNQDVVPFNQMESAQPGSVPKLVQPKYWPSFLFKLYAEVEPGKSVFVGMAGRYRDALFFCHHQVVEFPSSTRLEGKQCGKPKQFLGTVKDVIETPFPDIVCMKVSDRWWSSFLSVKSVSVAKEPFCVQMVTIFGAVSGQGDDELYHTSGLVDRVDNRDLHRASSNLGWSGSFGIVGMWDIDNPRARFIHTNGKNCEDGPNQGFPFDLVASWWDGRAQRLIQRSLQKAGRCEDSEEYFFQFIQDHAREIREAKVGVNLFHDRPMGDVFIRIGGKDRYFSDREYSAFMQISDFNKEMGNAWTQNQTIEFYKLWHTNGYDQEPEDFIRQHFGFGKEDEDATIDEYEDPNLNENITEEEEKEYYRNNNTALNDACLGETSEAVHELRKAKEILSAQSTQAAKLITQEKEEKIDLIRKEMEPLTKILHELQQQIVELRKESVARQKEVAEQSKVMQANYTELLKKQKAEEHAATMAAQKEASAKAKEEKASKIEAEKRKAIEAAAEKKAAAAAVKDKPQEEKSQKDKPKDVEIKAPPSSAELGPSEASFEVVMAKKRKKFDAKMKELKAKFEAEDKAKSKPSNSKAPQKAQGGSSSATGLKH